MSGEQWLNAPAQPTALSTESIEERVRLNWTATTDSTITGWRYRMRDKGFTTWGDAVSVPSGTSSTRSHDVDASSFFDDMLKEFQVQSYNGVGDSPWSDVATVKVQNYDKKLLTVSPDHLTVEKGDTASWTVVVNDDIAGTVNFHRNNSHFIATELNPPSLTFTAKNARTPQTVTATGVLAGHTDEVNHSFTLAGSTAVNIAEASETGVAIAVAGTPRRLKNFRARPGDGKVTLYWDRAETVYDYYEIRQRVNGRKDANPWGPWTRMPSEVFSAAGGLPTSYEVTGLTNGQKYLFRVRAVNYVSPGKVLEGKSSHTHGATPMDVLTVAVDDARIVEGNQGETRVEFVVTLNGEPLDDVQVTVEALAGVGSTATAEEGAAQDFIPFSDVIIFDQYAREQRKDPEINDLEVVRQVTVLGDLLPEEDETFQLRLSNLTTADKRVVFAGGGTELVVTGVIVDDDVDGEPELVVTVEDTNGKVGKPFSATASVKNTNPEDTVTYKWSVKSGPALPQGTDTRAATLGFTPTIESIGTYVLKVVATIGNDFDVQKLKDEVTIQVAPQDIVKVPNTFSVTEGTDSTATLPITADAAFGEEVTFTVTYGGTASGASSPSGNDDYDNDAVTEVTFGANDTTKNIVIPIYDDNEDEDDKTITVTIAPKDSLPGGFELLGGSTITIIDDDETPVLASIPAQTGEVGQSFSVTAAATDADGDTITYSWVKKSGPALPQGTTLNAAELSFTPTAAGTYVMTVTASDGTNSVSQDVTINVGATVFVLLQTPSVTEGTDSTATVTITTAGAAFGEEVTFTVAYGGTATGANSPSGNDDYDNDAVTEVTFGANDTNKDIVIPIYDDDEDEVNKTIEVTIAPKASLPAAFTLNPDSSTAAITIIDDDESPVLADLQDVLVAVGGVVNIQASATDADGDTISYAWTRKAGETPGLPGNPDLNNARFTFTPTRAGTYTMTVTANDGHGNTDSEDVTIKAIPSPAKPKNLDVAPDNGAVTLYWDTPDNANITKWQFQQKEGSNNYGPWTDMTKRFMHSYGGTTGYLKGIAGLTNGTVYSFKVRAVAGTIVGTASDEVTGTPMEAVPPELKVTIIPKNTNGKGYYSAELVWTVKNTDPYAMVDGAEKITAWWIYYRTKGADGWSSVYAGEGQSRSYTLNHRGIEDGREMEYRVHVNGSRWGGSVLYSIPGPWSNTVTKSLVDPVAFSVPATLQFTEGTDSNAVVTISASKALGAGKTATFNINYGGTATADVDYDDSVTSITFNATDTTKAITIPLVDDNLDEDNETITVTIAAAGSLSTGSLNNDKTIVTIVDDDETPVLASIPAQTGKVGQPFSVTASATDADGDTITYSWVKKSGPALPQSATLNAAELSFTPTVAGAYVMTVTASDGTNSVSQGVTINVVTPVSVSTGTPSVTEGTDSTATVTITADSAFGQEVTFRVSYGGTATGAGSPSGNDDYDNDAVEEITFGANDITKDIVIPIYDDNQDEINKTIDVNIIPKASLPGTFALDPDASTATITIIDDDASPVLADLEDVLVAVSEAVNIQASATDADGDTISYSWERKDGETAPALPETELSNARLTFTPTQAGTYTMKVTANDGYDNTDSKTVVITATLPPTKPANVGAAPGYKQVTLYWDNPGNTYGNAHITKWQVQQKVGGGNYGRWKDISGHATTNKTISYKIKRLTNGTTYGFKVRAIAGTIVGATSDEVTATPKQAVPPSLTTVRIRENPNDRGYVADLSWTVTDTDPHAIADGAQKILGWVIHYRKKGSKTYRWYSHDVSDGNARSVTLSHENVEDGAVMEYKIRAKGLPWLGGTETITASFGPWSNKVEKLLGGDPVIFSLQLASANSPTTTAQVAEGAKEVLVDIRASKPVAAGKTVTLGITYGGTATADADYNHGLTSSSVTFDAVNPSIGYTTIFLTDDNLDEDNETLSITIHPPAGESLPAGFEIGNAKMVITIVDDDHSPVLDDIAPVSVEPWKPVDITASATDADGDTISYEWSYAGTTASSCYTQVLNSDGSWSPTNLNSPRLTFTSSAQGSCNMTVTASDPYGNTDSKTVAISVKFTAPGAPTNLTAYPGDSLVTLRWDDPMDPAITRWQFRQKAGSNDYGDWQDIVGSGRDTTSHTVTNLSNRLRYHFQVRAMEDAVEGEPSEVSAAPNGAVTISVPPTLPVTEGTENYAVVTITASEALGKTVAFNISYGGTATATADADYDDAVTSVTFSATDTSKAITIPITDDNLDEDNETITVAISGSLPTGVSTGNTETVVTIVDDDHSPVLTDIRDLSIEPGTPVSMTASATDADGDTISYSWARKVGETAPALPGSPALNNARLAFTPTRVGTYTMTVTASDPHGNSDSDTVVIKVAESEVAVVPPTLAVTARSKAGCPCYYADLVWTVEDTRPQAMVPNADSIAGWTFAWRRKGTAGWNGFPISTSNAGTRTYTVSTTRVNAGDAVEYRVRAGGTAPGGSGIIPGPWSNTVTRIMPHSPISLPATLQVTEGTDSNAVVPINLPAALGRTTTFSVSYGGTATANEDYGNVATSVIFSATDTRKSITVPITDDNAEETNETITVTIAPVGSLPDGFSMGNSKTTVTIVDNDDQPESPPNDAVSATVSVPTTLEVTEGTDSNAVVTINSSEALGRTITFNVSYGGTATADVDYDDAVTSVTFSATDTSKSITIPITDDNLDEDEETITVTVTPSEPLPSTVSMGNAETTITIVDDDSSPVLAEMEDVWVKPNQVVSITASAKDADGDTISYVWTRKASETPALPDNTALNNAQLTFTPTQVGIYTMTVTASDSYGNADSKTVAVRSLNKVPIALQPPMMRVFTGQQNSLFSRKKNYYAGKKRWFIQLAPNISSTIYTGVQIQYLRTDSPEESLSGWIDTGWRYGSKYNASVSTPWPGTVDNSKVFFHSGGYIEYYAPMDYEISIRVRAVKDGRPGHPTAWYTFRPDVLGRYDSNVSKNITAHGYRDNAQVLISDATVQEAAGASLAFTVTLDRSASVRPQSGPITVHYTTRDGTAKAGEDYTATSGTVSFAPGQTQKTVNVAVLDDSHDEGSETMQLVASHISTVHVYWWRRSIPLGNVTGTGTITNTDLMPAAWLSRFGRTVADQALDAISDRMSAEQTPGLTGSLAGQPLPNVTFTDGSKEGDVVSDTTWSAAAGLALAEVIRREAVDPGSTTTRDVLLGSAFSATRLADGMGGNLTVWGQAAYSGFDGKEDTLSLDGKVTTGLLGIDYARQRWMLGLGVSHSVGNGSYDGSTDGKTETSLTAAIPYGSWQATEWLKLWGALGYGMGQVTLKPEGTAEMKADLNWTMAAVGARATLLDPGGQGLSLDLISDALWTRTASEKATGLKSSESNVTRLRLGLEGTWQVPLQGSSELVSKLSVGTRYDGGDAETGFGAELGGGITWSNPGIGLTLDIDGRTLLAHAADGLKDWGFSAGLAFDPKPATDRGLSLSLGQDWGGETTGGLDALFASDPLSQRTGTEATSRWTMEAAYGLPAFSEHFTGSPYVGLALSAGNRDYNIGWRLTSEADAIEDLSFDLKVTRSENDGSQPEHRVGVELRRTW